MTDAPDTFEGSNAQSTVINDIIAPIRDELETKRATWERLALIGRIVLALIGVGGGAMAAKIYFETGTFGPDAIPFGIAALIGLVGAVLIRSILLRFGLADFKGKIVPAILSHFGTFDYDPRPSRFLHNNFRISGLLPEFSRAKNEDYISGTYRGQSLEMIQLKLYQQEEDTNSSDDEDGGAPDENEIFNGIVVKIENPRQLEGSYGLVPQRMDMQGFEYGYPRDWRRIKLESDQFEGEYDFVGTDQIEGRTLLTPKQMERWHEFATRKGTFSVAAIFEDGFVHLAVNRKGDFIDDAMMDNNKGAIEDQVNAMAADIESVLKAVDALIFAD